MLKCSRRHSNILHTIYY